MIDQRSRGLLRLLRVPPSPHLPAGQPGSARVFRAGRNYWRLRLAGWIVRQAFTLAGFIFLMVTLHMAPETIPIRGKSAAHAIHLAAPLAWMRSLEMFLLGLWLVQLPITLALLRLDYELRWYIVTDRAARLREGILNLREMTFTLANVQDIRIQQGPLQRLLGLADVELRTAGGGEVPAGHAGQGASEARSLHIARFRGVDNAEAIRDLVVDRMRKVRSAGLGDPDDVPPPPPVSGAFDVASAAREMMEESARLRATVGRLAGA